METFKWLTPQPMWAVLDMADSSSVRGPVIAKFRGDGFMDHFLAAVEGESIAGLETTASNETLFLPFHGSYHLVMASLVCNRLGFPDRALDTASGESVGFVLRRLGVSASDESAWVSGQGWIPLVDAGVLGADAGTQEEVFPLVRSRTGERCLWHGFVPLASGETAKGKGKFAGKPGSERFTLRCVYRRPQCRHEPLVVSARSAPFRTSTFMDSKAPQRKVEINLDMGSLVDLGRPVSFTLGSSVEDAVSQVREYVADKLSSLGMSLPGKTACEKPGFSIPWITLVAFILLMIITAIFWPIAVILKVLLPGGTPCPESVAPALPEGEGP